MADAIVSSIVDEVVGRLASVADEEIRLLRSFKSDLLDLQSKFSRIQAVLERAEAKQRMDKDIEDWLRKLRAASFEMENILDEVSTEAMIRRVDNEKGIKRKIGAFFSTRNPVAFRSRIAHQVKNVRTRLDAIAEEKSKFGLEGVSKDKGVVGDLGSRLTSSRVNEPEIEGRDVEKKMIIKKICDENLVDHGDDVSVYAIWGMGGIGKTTLTQLVYNDQRTSDHFVMKIWVCVSYDFDIRRLTGAIIESIEGKPCTLSQLDALQKTLQEKLHGKRFLLVLDDVWNEDHTKWEGLKEGLKCGARGSVVMVTTRIETIARAMARHLEFIHRIGFLSKEESWSLFKRLAFAAGRKGGNQEELEPIGEKIADKCQGLPLALKALGSLMWSKDSTREWSSVLGSDIWDLPQDEVSILPALRLSYDNLPHHFRQCFAYCCVFPKDYKMSKELMIMLWMANNFIPSSRGEDLYVVGEEIFKGLVWRSFFQDVVEEEDKLVVGAVNVTCKMHDLMHDLALSVMGRECSELGKKLKFPEEVLHVSSFHGLPTDKDLAKVRYLRSILAFGDYVEEKKYSLPNHIFNQKYLRVLILTEAKFRKLPKSICNLKLLRYLNLSHSEVEVLPESIICLQNLQFLNLSWCSDLRKLPKGMRHMKNLKFLEIKGCYRLEKMPSGMGQLTGLRRLSQFIVGKTKEGKGIGELGELNLLERELLIVGLEMVRNSEEAQGAKLKCKQNLIDLNVIGAGDKEEVLEGLEPHSNLKKFEISLYSGLRFASWIVNLVNLTELKLERCDKLEILPGLGTLPLLRILTLRYMDALKSFDGEQHAIDSSKNTSSREGGLGDPNVMVLFPSLQELKIDMCYRLIRLPSYLPKLEKLSIISCKGLVSLPDRMGEFLSLTSLEILFCQELKCLPDGLQNLKALKSVNIIQCKQLSRRCEENKGEDWPKIAHVPQVRVRIE